MTNSPPRQSVDDNSEAVDVEEPVDDLPTPVRSNLSGDESSEVADQVSSTTPPVVDMLEVEIEEEDMVGEEESEKASMTDKTAPMLAKLSLWGKQANANAKDFWSKRRVTTAVFAETLKKSLPLTSASLDLASPRSKPSEASNKSAEELKIAAETKEAETLPKNSFTTTNATTPTAANKATTPRDDTSLNMRSQRANSHLDSLKAALTSSVTCARTTDSLIPDLLAPIPLRSVETAPANLLSMRSLLSPQSIASDDASSSFVSNNDDDTASSYWSSTYASDEGLHGVRGTFKWAAASVVDSMQTYRGRYTRSMSENAAEASGRSGSVAEPTGSQTHRTLQSRSKQHVQDLMEKLEPHEYVMLLGQGMLGVNLKSTYLKNIGVYIDYLVRGGAAQRSGIIRPGDMLCRIGELDVRKGNILQVPGQIAQARRPVHLIFATGVVMHDRVNYIDITTALLHTLVDAIDRRNTVRFEDPPAKESDNYVGLNNEEESNVVMELVKPVAFDGNEKGSRSEGSDPTIPDISPSNYGFLRPEIPPHAVRVAFASRAAQRCNEMHFRADRIWPAASTDVNFVRALKHAFALTTADPRRLNFLVKQWSREDDEAAAHTSRSKLESQITSSPNAILMLYSELCRFVDLYDLTPVERRREIAQKIANKFFLPISLGNELVPPMLDFHHMVSDTALRTLEATLHDESTPINIDIFQDFQQAVIDTLIGQHFLSFFVSDECSCMRGYMRNTAPFLNLPLNQVLNDVVENPKSPAKNYLLYVLVYLITQTDPEEIGESVDPETGNKDKYARVDDAAANLCAALYIRRFLLLAIHTIEEKKNKRTMDLLLKSFEHFWEVYLSPIVGSLESTSLTSDTRAKVKMVRMELEQIGAPCRHASLKLDDEAAMLTSELTVSQLVEPQLVENLESLAESLLYDYAVIDHSKFRAHKIHEWMCQEAIKSDYEKDPEKIPSFAPNCIKRLLRKITLPHGVSSHKPLNSSGSADHSLELGPDRCTAECALVFGTSTDTGFSFQPAGGVEGVQRFACKSLGIDDTGALSPEQVPPTLEGYAVVPNASYRPALRDYNSSGLTSVDGWEISLLNFKVPRADSASDNEEDSALYGVSLVLRREATYHDGDTNTIPTTVVQSPLGENKVQFHGSSETGNRKRTIHVRSDCSVFNSNLKQQHWRKLHSVGSVIVGIALVSRHNAIPSMRQALTLMLHGFSGTGNQSVQCNGLADFLGNFANMDVETDVIGDFLKPFLDESMKPWLERPFGAQQSTFENESGEQLIRSLPPVPLALLFIAALLEQKIVITGSRRSILLSATTALTEMLKPLKWCHLLVPRVPASLAADLLQYPAPFILGIPAQDPGILELIRDLQDDITLVDLDVGRVILASSFAHNAELCRGTPKNETTARAMRTQVLSLAQSLGNVFGACVDPISWGCDRVFGLESLGKSPYVALKAACRDFVEELLAGTASCCYWVEESSKDGGSYESTVLFDEDRYFHIKGERRKTPYAPLFSSVTEGTKLALGTNGFEMVLEVFLRCQSMNAYIGSCHRGSMSFSL